MPKSELEWADFEPTRNRLPLPMHLVKAASNSGLSGTDTVECWLVVLGPGRYRIASSEAASRILGKIEEIESPGDILDSTENDARNASPARLIRCTVSAPPPTWRLNFPQKALMLVSDAARPSYVFLMIVAGFIEIWFPDTLRRVVEVPLSRVISL